VFDIRGNIDFKSNAADRERQNRASIPMPVKGFDRAFEHFLLIPLPRFDLDLLRIARAAWLHDALRDYRTISYCHLQAGVVYRSVCKLLRTFF
jgi:hypothetical protein